MKWANKAKQDTEQVITATVFDLSSAIVMRTPVDNGFARGGWFASINVPSDNVGNVPNKTGSLSLTRAQKFSEQAPGAVFYFVNNLPYIRPLEYGTYGRGPYTTDKTAGTGFSIQAPGGMVRISLMRFTRALKKAIRDVS